MMTTRRATIIAVLVAVAALAGCGGGGDPPGGEPSPPPGAGGGGTAAEFVGVAAVAPDFSSGAHALVEREDPFTTQLDLSPTISDIDVTCRSDALFRVERFQRDNITRFDLDAPGTAVWQYSAQDDPDDPVSANPRAPIFANDTKAYLLRYGKPTVWIIDPTATVEADFKTGELDLSSYTDDLVDAGGAPSDPDGTPEPETGVIVDGKLFIAMQRLDRNDGFRPLTAFVAVFDVATDSEIDTMTHPDVFGIELPVQNPQDIQYSPELDRVFVQAVGRFGSGDSPPELTGGLVAIDPDTYTVELRVDDGTAEDNPIGQINGFALVDRNTGYLIGSQGFLDTSLYRFDPETGLIDGGNPTPQPVAGLAGVDIRDLAVDAQKRLWIARGDGTPGLQILDPATDTLREERIPTNLIPAQVSLCQD